MRRVVVLLASTVCLLLGASAAGAASCVPPSEAGSAASERTVQWAPRSGEAVYAVVDCTPGTPGAGDDPAGQLPFTGSEGLVLIAGGLLLVVGGTLLAAARRLPLG
jgi:LPXTG cell wall anchor motif